MENAYEIMKTAYEEVWKRKRAEADTELMESIKKAVKAYHGRHVMLDYIIKDIYAVWIKDGFRYKVEDLVLIHGRLYTWLDVEGKPRRVRTDALSFESLPILAKAVLAATRVPDHWLPVFEFLTSRPLDDGKGGRLRLRRFISRRWNHESAPDSFVFETAGRSRIVLTKSQTRLLYRLNRP